MKEDKEEYKDLNKRNNKHYDCKINQHISQ